jgi:hypothetical protein
MLITASNIFLAFGSGFLSPNETEILAPFPITSETFFFSRMAIVLTYSLIASSLISIGPMIAAGFFAREALPMSVIGILLMTSFAAITSATGVITMYAIVVARIPHKKLMKAFSLVQFLGSLLVGGTFILAGQVARRIQLDGLTLSAHSWLKFAPPYWFAGIEGVAIGHPNTGALALAAIVTLLGLSFASYKLFARSYGAAIEDLTQSSIADTKRYELRQAARNKGTSSGFSQLLRTPETRAMWTLFKAQFKFDSKFRFSLFSWLPLMGFYFVLAVVQGSIHDPFGPFNPDLMRSNALYLLAILSPLLIMQQISQSESYKASWIFYATPIDRARLLLGVRNIVVLLIFAPYMVLLGVAFSFYMPPLSAFRHTLMISAFAQLIFEVSLLFAPKMPFSQQRTQQRNTAGRIFTMMLVILAPLILMALVMYFGYRDEVRYWASLALVITLAVITDRLVANRLRKKLEEQEFAG